jgi:hypothetical protein
MTTTAIRRSSVYSYTTTESRPGCPAEKHADTRYAWNFHGCRCPGAERAHREYIERARVRDRARRRSTAKGDCTARSHRPTPAAYRIAGCRCPETVAVYEAEQLRRYETEMQRLAGEWGNWRRVSSITVDLMLAGYPGDPNRAERMIAVRRMMRLGYRHNEYIAARLHLAVSEVATARWDPTWLRGRRSERRRDEAKARALRNAYLAERRAAIPDVAQPETPA